MSSLQLRIAESEGREVGFEALANVLVEPGYGFFTNAVDEETCRGLLGVLADCEANVTLRRARVGKGAARELQSEIRSDSIYWLTRGEGELVVNQWLDWVEAFRVWLRRALFLPLEHYEGHLARYPEGGFYKPHLDQHQVSPHRQITLIIYLNESWCEADGGQLRLFTDKQQGIRGESLVITPSFGSLVIFRSADFWHEVLPAKHPRYSLTGWLRDDPASPVELIP